MLVCVADVEPPNGVSSKTLFMDGGVGASTILYRFSCENGINWFTVTNVQCLKLAVVDLKCLNYSLVEFPDMRFK